MIDYTGLECPICGEKFTAQDDIVVCPECGAPYHRACYLREGKCAFADKHGTAEAWQPPKKEAAQENAEAQSKDEKRCPRCGKSNSSQALFCDHCGLPLSGGQAAPPAYTASGGFPPFQGVPPQNPTGGPQNGPASPQGPFQSPFGAAPFFLDPMGGLNPNDQIDGAPVNDIAKLVQTNTAYYLPTFFNLRRYRRNRFNFCAFLCSGGWMLYRKQYKTGAIVTASMLLLFILEIYFTGLSQPIITNMLIQAGASPGTAVTMEQYMQAMQGLYSLPWTDMLILIVPFLCSLGRLIIMFIIGFTGNKMYCKHCVQKVLRIRESTGVPDEQALQLQQQGGVNTALAVCMLVCYVILMCIPQLMI